MKRFFLQFQTVLSVSVLLLLLVGCQTEDRPITLDRGQVQPDDETTTAPTGDTVDEQTAEKKPAEPVKEIPEARLSLLWGMRGEKWSPQSRLPDFSWAGYQRGEPIPDVPVAANVRDFGAVGDGETDDTEAIQRAIDSVQKGAVLLPAGRYKITATLKIEKSNIVLRGEGPDQTEFWVPKSLLEIEGGESYQEMGQQKTKFAFGSAFVEIHGGEPAPPLTEVVGEADRGDRQIEVASAAAIRPGTWVRLWMHNHPDLGLHLHNGCGQVGSGLFGRAKKLFVDWVAKVEAVDGNTLTLDRPLRTDIRLDWKPLLRSYSPTVTGSGIEGITFRFAGREKRPHLMEEGFNAVELRMVSHCWVRDLRIIDADMGVLVSYSRFCTVEGIEILADKRNGIPENGWEGHTGHHGLWVAGFSQDNLVQDFTFKTLYHHDLTVENFANGNVFRHVVPGFMKPFYRLPVKYNDAVRSIALNPLE